MIISLATKSSCLVISIVPAPNLNAGEAVPVCDRHSVYIFFSQDYLLEVVGATLLVILLPYLVRVAWQRWRIYKAFRTVPCDPDMHFFFGHAPRVNNF